MTFPEIMEEMRDYDILPEDYYVEEKKALPKTTALPLDSINLFDPMQVKYYRKEPAVKEALSEIRKRRLDKAINRPKALFISTKDFVHKNRLCIPFYDATGKIVFFQTRALYKDDELDGRKYISKLNAEKTVFGVDKIDEKIDTLFIFEGPIDAMFVKNGLAVGGISMSELQEEILDGYKFYNKIWVLDNQYKDASAKDKMKDLMEKGHTVFVWPYKYRGFKDLNELCIKTGLNKVKPEFFIDNAYEGMKGLLKVS